MTTFHSRLKDKLLLQYNDNSNPDHWTNRGMRRQDTSNSPYYNQPLHSPYLYEKFAIASVVCGGLAIIFNFIFVLSLPAASMGFIFIALAHRKGKKHSRILTYGIIFCSIGLAAAIIGAFVFYVAILPQLLQDPVYNEILQTIWDLIENP